MDLSGPGIDVKLKKRKKERKKTEWPTGALVAAGSLWPPWFQFNRVKHC